ncbi:MAG TPA: dihydropteroate synthase [Vicinamibacterales bacterium]|nr:dihydropteroate synthase [Vicinamibacterales bacterium]
MLVPTRRGLFHVLLPNGQILKLGERTLVMGIVNVTPDSFSDGGLRADAAVAVRDALRMVEDGADLLDIGGESTRPGAAPLDLEEEWRRVGPVIAGLRDRMDVPISIDTYKAEIARRALDNGATIVNDISGFTYDPAIAGVVAERRAVAILMHNRGRSAAMYERANYHDVAAEVTSELEERVAAAEAAGVPRSHLMVDPGLGFAKRPAQTMEMIAGLSTLGSLRCPVVSGPSRKSFLQAALGERPPEARVWGTAAAVAASIWLGAHIVRVHDVAAMVDVARVTDALLASAPGS